MSTALSILSRDRDTTLLSPAFAYAHRLETHPCRWLWPARIPPAKLTLLLGDPGVGKSLLTADLAARVSAGYAWPDAPTWSGNPWVPHPLPPLPPGHEPNPEALLARAIASLPFYA